MPKIIRPTAEERDDLRAFAQRVEQQILASANKGMETMERLICRALTSKKQPAVAATVAHKWVEWRYGRAVETVKVEGHIEHTVFDATKLSDEQLNEAERLIESASVASD